METTMIKLNVGKNNRGIVYVLKIWVDDDKCVYKVGVAARKYSKGYDNRLEKRVCEISTAFYQVYRYFPKIKPLRFKEVNNHFKMETVLHHMCCDYRYCADKQIDGCTELFDIDEDMLIEMYDNIVGEYR